MLVGISRSVSDFAYATYLSDLAVRLSHQISVTGAIDNLTDRRYMEPLGFPALGRAARIGLKAAF